MAVLHSLHRALRVAQSDERTAVLRYLLLHAMRPLLMNIQGWLGAVEQQVHSALTAKHCRRDGSYVHIASLGSDG